MAREADLVRGGLELVSGDLRDLGGDLDVESDLCVESGSDGGSTLSEQAQPGDHVLDSGDGVGELLDVARELLAERERGGVLEVGSSNLDDVLERLSLDLHRVSELVQRGEEGRVELGDGSNVHRSREAETRRDGGNREERGQEWQGVSLQLETRS